MNNKLLSIIAVFIGIILPMKTIAQTAIDEEVYSPEFVFEGDNLVMTCETEGADIYYVISEFANDEEAESLREYLDVSEANSMRTLYTQPIPITKNVVVKAVAKMPGKVEESYPTTLVYNYTLWLQLTEAIEYGSKVLTRAEDNPLVSAELKEELQQAIEEGEMIYSERGMMEDSSIAKDFADNIMDLAHQIEEIIGPEQTGPEPYAVLNDNNTLLTFYYDEKKGERNGMGVGPFQLADNMVTSDWYDHRESITDVVFDASFANCTTLTSTAFWFYECDNLTTVTDISNLKTDNVTSMAYMFYGCSSLTSLDVSGFNTENVTNMEGMFANCSGLAELDLTVFNTGNVTNMGNMFSGCQDLTTIYAGNGWSTANVTGGNGMFNDCSSIIGGAGTRYDVNFTSYTFAHIDGGISNPGYLTDIDAPYIPEVVLTGKIDNLWYDEGGEDPSGDEAIIFTLPRTTESGNFWEINVLTTFIQNKLAFTTPDDEAVDNISGEVLFGWNDFMWPEDDGKRLMYENQNQQGEIGMIEPDMGMIRIINSDITQNLLNDPTSEYMAIPVTVTAHRYGYEVPVMNGNFTVLLKLEDEPQGPEPYAVLSQNNTLLTFYYDEKREERNGMGVGPFQMADNMVTSGWYDQREIITNVVFDASFANCTTLTSTAFWFYECKNLTTVTGISNLKTDNVTDMRGMFTNCSGLAELDLTGFNTGSVTDMRRMFAGCQNLTTIYAGEKWSTASVTEGSGMFNDCSSIIGGAGTRFDAHYTDQTFAHIDGGSNNPGYLTDINAPYIPEVLLAGKIDNLWYDESGTNPSGDEAIIFTLPRTPDSGDFWEINVLTAFVQNKLAFTTFDNEAVDNISGEVLFGWSDTMVPLDDGKRLMYENQNQQGEIGMIEPDMGMIRIINSDITQNLLNDPTSEYMALPITVTARRYGYEVPVVNGSFTVLVKLEDLHSPEPYAVLSQDDTVLTFYYDTNKAAFTESINIDPYNWSDNASDITTVVFDASFAEYTSLTTTSGWFSNFGKLTSIQGLSNLRTDNVTNMSWMFSGCTSLKDLDVSGFYTANVTDMSGMFERCSSLTDIDVSGFTTDNVTNMNEMFEGCSALTTLDLHEFQTGNVTSMKSMFGGCSSLTSLDLSGFNTAQVTNMSGMFNECTKLQALNVSGFNTSNVRVMEYMFSKCSSLTTLDLSSFSTAKLEDIDGMFQGCSALTTIYVTSNWDISKVTSSNEMFSGCTGLVGGAGTRYHANQTDYTYAHIDGGTDNPGYLTDKDAPTSREVILLSDENGMIIGKIVAPSGNTEQFEIVGGKEAVFKAPNGSNIILTFRPNAGYRLDDVILNGNSVRSQMPTDSTYVIQNVLRNMELIATFAALPTEAYALLSNNNTVLTFYYDRKREERDGMSVGPFSYITDTDGSYHPNNSWYQQRGNITNVVFDASFANCTSITSTAYWFIECSKLTTITGLNNLKTENVTNMASMFDDCSSLTSLDVSGFKTENVTNMSCMFRGCSALTSLDVSRFNTAKVTYMNSMFEDCRSLQSLNVSGFKTENVINMEAMFFGCSGLTSLDLSGFNTDKVTNMNGLFYKCSGLTTIYAGEKWTTKNVKEGDNMFRDCTSLVGGAGTRYDANHIDADYAHIDGGRDNPGYLTDKKLPTSREVILLSGEYGMIIGNIVDPSGKTEEFEVAGGKEAFFNVPNGSNVNLTFRPNAGYSLADVVLNGNSVRSQMPTDSTYVIQEVLENMELIATFTSLPTEAYAALSNNNTVLTFYYDVFKKERNGMSIEPFSYITDTDGSYHPNNGWYQQRGNITNVVFDASFANYTTITSTAYWFIECRKLTTIKGLNNLKTENVTNMASMFDNCSSLTDLDVSGFKTENVTNMSCMFRGCSALTSLDVSRFNTAKVTYMSSMFDDCRALNSLDVREFKTDNVINMEAMFSGCSSLTSLDLSGFNTDNVTSMYYMFINCTSLRSLDVSNFNTEKVTNMGNMFTNCPSLTSLDLSGFNTDKVINMNGLFYNCSSLTTIYAGEKWTTKNVREGDDLFTGCTKLMGGAGTRYDADHTDTAYAHIDGGTANPGYFTDKDAPAAHELILLSSQNGIIFGRIVAPSGNIERFEIVGGKEASFYVPNGSNVSLTFRPDDGYILADVIRNGRSVRSEMPTDSTYVIQDIFENMELMVTFAALPSESYAVLSNNNTVLTFYYDRNREERNGMSVGPFDDSHSSWYDYRETIASVVFDDTFANNTELSSTRLWFEDCGNLTTISGIENLNTRHVTDMRQMFKNCSSLINIDLRSLNIENVTSIEGIFEGCSNLASIQAGIARIPAEEYTKIGNPNLLVYVFEPSFAPEGIQNVVINGVAREIVLTDVKEGNNNWNCPEPFRAEKISYTRNFRQQTEVGISRGWESIALPFTVQTITHEAQGTIIPFGAQGTGKYFWLRGYSSEGLQRATVIEANTPYVISMPNNPAVYPYEYNLNGSVTFSAENTIVPGTPDFEDMLITRGNITMAPVFVRVPRDEAVYAINVGQPLDRYAEGSVFTRELREVRPFEAATTHEPVNGVRPQNIRIAAQPNYDITGIKTIEIDETEGTWFSIDGRQIQGQPQRKGVYLQNGKKVVVK